MERAVDRAGWRWANSREDHDRCPLRRKRSRAEEPKHGCDLFRCTCGSRQKPGCFWPGWPSITAHQRCGVDAQCTEYRVQHRMRRRSGELRRFLGEADVSWGRLMSCSHPSGPLHPCVTITQPTHICPALATTLLRGVNKRHREKNVLTAFGDIQNMISTESWHRYQEVSKALACK